MKMETWGRNQVWRWPFSTIRVLNFRAKRIESEYVISCIEKNFIYTVYPNSSKKETANLYVILTTHVIQNITCH